MRQDGWKNGLAWAGLTAAVSGVVVAGGRVPWESRSTAAPGHDAGTCGDRRAHRNAQGSALPYELDDTTIRFIPPDARSIDGTERGG